jgi:hypothetical protein
MIRRTEQTCGTDSWAPSEASIQEVRRMPRGPSDPSETDRIEVVGTRQGKRDVPQLLINGVPVPHGRLFDGTYYLMDNAYEWDTDLLKLGVRHARYLADASRRAGRTK